MNIITRGFSKLSKIITRGLGGIPITYEPDGYIITADSVLYFTVKDDTSSMITSDSKIYFVTENEIVSTDNN